MSNFERINICSDGNCLFRSVATFLNKDLIKCKRYNNGKPKSKNLQQFALTFQCMSKFGNEMTFEVTSNCLLLRVLNDAKTVFLTFRFGDAFFEKYQLIGFLL